MPDLNVFSRVAADAPAQRKTLGIPVGCLATSAALVSVHSQTYVLPLLRDLDNAAFRQTNEFGERRIPSAGPARPRGNKGHHDRAALPIEWP